MKALLLTLTLGLLLLGLSVSAQPLTMNDPVFGDTAEGVAGYEFEGDALLFAQLDSDYRVYNTNGTAAGIGEKVYSWESSVATPTAGVIVTLTNVTAANNRRPYYNTSDGPGGLGYLVFPSTNTTSAGLMMATTTQPDMAGTQPYAHFLVVRCHARATDSHILTGTYSPTTRAYVKHRADESLAIGGSVAAIGGAADSLVLEEWLIVSAYYTNVGSFCRTNGVLYVSGNAGTQSKTGWGMGWDNDTLVICSDDIAAYRFYQGSMSSNDVRAVELEMGAKYGISIP